MSSGRSGPEDGEEGFCILNLSPLIDMELAKVGG